jgi:type II secretion system protein J
MNSPHAARGTGTTRSRRAGRRGDRGFTLIELLVAVGLMAVLAVLSWRGLETILQSRERLVSSSDELRSLTLALSQLEEDLLHSSALRPLDLDEQELRIQVGGERQQQTLVLLREVNRMAMPTRLQRVFYEVRNGVLVRGFTEWRRPTAESNQAQGVGAIVWQPILANVAEIRFRGWMIDPNAPVTAVQSSGSTGPGDGTRVWLDAVSLGQQLEAVGAARMQARALELAQRLQAAMGATGSAATATGTGVGGQGLAGVVAGERTGLAARRVAGLELVLARTNGQRFGRVYSVAY